jgi:hypothetical protein
MKLKLAVQGERLHQKWQWQYVVLAYLLAVFGCLIGGKSLLSSLKSMRGESHPAQGSPHYQRQKQFFGIPSAKLPDHGAKRTSVDLFEALRWYRVAENASQ